MLGFQGQLQVSLLWDPSKAGLAPEPAAGGHPVHGHAAAAPAPKAQVSDLAQSQPAGRPPCPRWGSGVSFAWENIQRSVSQTLNIQGGGGGGSPNDDGKNKFTLASGSSVLGEPRHRRLESQPRPANRAFGLSPLKKKKDRRYFLEQF